jgi:hypothetical protein
LHGLTLDNKPASERSKDNGVSSKSEVDPSRAFIPQNSQPKLDADGVHSLSPQKQNVASALKYKSSGQEQMALGVINGDGASEEVNDTGIGDHESQGKGKKHERREVIIHMRRILISFPMIQMKRIGRTASGKMKLKRSIKRSEN